MSEVIETPETQVVEPVVPEPAPEPIAEPIAAPEPEEKIYTYQPTDETGRPIGGKQVLKYRTEEELRQKFTEQNTLLIRKLREETRKNRLGILDDAAEDAAIADAPRAVDPYSFEKPTLTAEERAKLAFDLGIDPERLDETTDRLFQSKLGVNSDELRQVLKQLQEESYNARSIRESDAFMAANKDYYKCPENGKAITGWMWRKGLAPVRENFQRAYETLKAAGVLIEAGQVESTPEPPPQPPPPPPASPSSEPVDPVNPVTEPTPAVVVEEPQPQSRLPTGLTRSNSADAGIPRKLGDDIVYEVRLPDGSKKVFRGMQAINAMPADVFKHRLTDKGFATTYAKMEAEAEARRNKRS